MALNFIARLITEAGFFTNKQNPMNAKIKLNEKGGWSIYIGSRIIGNYAHRIDALRVCLRNKIKWDVLDA